MSAQREWNKLNRSIVKRFDRFYIIYEPWIIMWEARTARPTICNVQFAILQNAWRMLCPIFLQIILTGLNQSNTQYLWARSVMYTGITTFSIQCDLLYMFRGYSTPDKSSSNFLMLVYPVSMQWNSVKGTKKKTKRPQ